MKALSEEIREYIAADAAAGVSADRIRARVYIQFGNEVPIRVIEDIAGTRQRLLMPVVVEMTFHPVPAGVYDQIPELRNLWANLRGRESEWNVYRSQFTNRGQHMYRVCCDNGEAFDVWASSFDGFKLAMRRRGVQVVCSQQGSLFTMSDYRQREAA